MTAASAHAVPVRQDRIVITQPDGSSFKARPFGDEWSNGLETEDGYTIIEGSDQWWRYAEPSAGGLIESPLVVGRDLPSSLRRRVRVPAAAPPRGASESSATGADHSQASVSQGDRPTIVILVEYNDVRGRNPPEYWRDRIFGGQGSLKEYYAQASFGHVNLVPATESNGSLNDGVAGWIRLDMNHPITGRNTGQPNQALAQVALLMSSAYPRYDTNGNGTVSADELFVIIIVAGYEKSFDSYDTSCSPSVWGHRWSAGSFRGIPGLDYAQFGETHGCGGGAHPATLGIIAHETGHLFGLPDLYDPDGDSSGVGKWSLMGTGSWNGLLLGDLPALLDPWSKKILGWVTPQLLAGLVRINIPPAATSPRTYRFGEGTEYFLVENRQRISYDEGLPGEGVLVWHVDESVQDNRVQCIPGDASLPCRTPFCVLFVSCGWLPTHYKVALVQKDNAFDLELHTNGGDAGDAWPTPSKLSDRSSPRSLLYDGSSARMTVAPRRRTPNGSIRTLLDAR